MVFLYIAAAVCMVLCIAGVALAAYALRRFRRWRGSVMERLADLDAMVAAVPGVIRKESAERIEKATFGRGLVFDSMEEAVCTIYNEHTRRLETLPSCTSELIKQELAHDRELTEEKEAEEKGKKRDLIDEFFGVFNYGLADAMRAAKAECDDE